MAPDTQEISSEELAWDEASVQEGRRPGAVVSVRLDAEETARLRGFADRFDLNVSQVVRRALADYNPDKAQAAERVFLSAFTYGGTVPTFYEQVWRWVVSEQLGMPTEERTGSGNPVPTSTEPIRIVERVTV